MPILRYKGVLVAALFPEGIPPDVLSLAAAGSACRHTRLLGFPCWRCMPPEFTVENGRAVAAFNVLKMRYRYRREVWGMKKPVGPEKGVAWVAEDEEFRAEYPRIHEYLTTTAWEDGSARETSTILLFAEGHQFKVCINDRSTGMAAFLTGDTIKEVLRSLDTDLEQERVNWRPTRTGGRK